jgi:hypothetical protein
MRALTRAGVSIVAIAVVAQPAQARQARATEVVPYVALGAGPVAPVGAALLFPVTSALSVEADVAYRRGEGDIHAMSANFSLLVSLPRVGATTPYAVAGLGLAQYGVPILGASGPPAGTQSRMSMTLNAGAGLKTPISRSLGLRTDVRVFKALGQNGADQFRVSQGLSFGVRR